MKTTTTTTYKKESEKMGPPPPPPSSYTLIKAATLAAQKEARMSNEEMSVRSSNLRLAFGLLGGPRQGRTLDGSLPRLRCRCIVRSLITSRFKLPTSSIHALLRQ